MPQLSRFAFAFLFLPLFWLSCKQQTPATETEIETKAETTQVENSAPLPDSKKADRFSDSLYQDQQEQTYEESLKLENYLVAEPASNDITTIRQKAGVFISPDSVQIEKLKKQNGEENFYTIADDNIYYEYEAGEFLKKHRIAEVHPKTRYLKFVTKSKTFYFDTKANVAWGWTTVLFDPEKLAPKIINPVDIEEEYQVYLK